MTPERAKELFKLAISLSIPEEEANDPDDIEREFDDDERPTYLLLDDIWEIIDSVGDGTAAIIHHDGAPDEVVIYDRSASQHDNVVFMEHIYLALEEGCLVTINGTDIFDLY